MLILKVDAWHLFPPAIIAAAEIEAIQDMVQFRRHLEEEYANEVKKLAQRALRIRRRAYQSGIALGQRIATEQASKVFAENVQVWKQIEEHVACVIFDSVKSILGALPSSLLLEAQIKKCIATARASNSLTLRVHPESAPDACAVVKRLERQAGVSLCEVVVDANLRAGACLLETEDGVIEGDSFKQLAIFRDAVFSASCSAKSVPTGE